jgi:predicted P-loop ATPase
MAKLSQISDFSKQNAEKLQENLLSEVEQTTFLPMPIGDSRLDTVVSIVTGISPEIKEVISLRELFKRFKDNTQLEKTQQLHQAYSENKELYKKLKNQCKGFVLNRFSHRDDRHCISFAPIMAFDIDGYEDDFYLSLDVSELKKDDYIFAAFPSPSGHGLRILIWADVTIDTFKLMYETIVKHLCDRLNMTTEKQKGVHIDISTSNISRHWYYTALQKDEFYLNCESKVFPKFLEQPMAKKEAKSTVKNTSSDVINISTHDKIDFCVSRLQDLYSYGGRNNYVFRLAATMNEHGISKDTILTYCSQFKEQDFQASEIEKAINSALKRSSFAKYSDENIAHYIAKREKKSIPKSIAPNYSTNDEDDSYTTTPKKGKTKIDKIINYCNEHYDLRFNIISIEVEGSPKKENQFVSVNTNDLVIELLRQKINGCERLLKIFLSSNIIKRYDPFLAYFEQLPKWEGEKDYIAHLSSFVEVQDRYFFDTQFKKMLVRMVACAIGKIPFNKQCIAFVGKQNDGKTTFARFLCPPLLSNYMKENLEMDKDGKLALCQNFIINLDELATLSKQDINQIKTYFTIDYVKERPPYGDKPITFKRRANFIATTNNDEFLTDETGNVRWVVFKIDGIKHDSGGKNGYNQSVDIDEVWAQAYTLLQNGFEYELTKDELAYSEKNNRKHQKTYMEIELIQSFFVAAKKGEEGAEFMNATMIKETIEVAGAVTRKLNTTIVGKALRELGFEQSSDRKPNRTFTIKGYWVKNIHNEEKQTDVF